MEKMKRVELLAPAGNMEGFYGAIHAGADAVYLGGSRYGARAYAENFTTEELVAGIRYGHILGRKIYLTVNTLVKEEELSALYEYLAPLYEAGLDGVIIQDLGVFRFIKENFPEMELHASTQMALCSKYGAGLLKDMGASRIVPARELSLRELCAIREDTEIELETFIHGAMCYCYSGQCLFSSILGGRSGNRGRCAQPCRLPYGVESESNPDLRRPPSYPLSLKDMCTIEHIPDFIEAGLDSFKIEGRMKKPEYAAGVTAVYRQYIDRYYALRNESGSAEAKKRFRIEKDDLSRLSALYIRSELQDGYYYKHNGREMVNIASPAYSGSDERLLAEIREKYLSERLRRPVQIEAVFLTGHPAVVTMRTEQNEVRVTGEMVSVAQNQSVTQENIRKQLGKLGDSCFFAENITVEVSANAFFPLKQINELRRNAVAELASALLRVRVCAPSATAERPNSEKASEAQSGSADSEKLPAGAVGNRQGYAVSVTSLEQLKTLVKWREQHEKFTGLCRIYVDGDLAVDERSSVIGLCDRLRSMDKLTVLLMLPYIVREEDKAYLEIVYGLIDSGSFDGVLTRSLDGLGFLRRKGGREVRRADAGVYVWNHGAASQLEALGITDGFCLPYELKAGEQHGLLRSTSASFEKIVYGLIPMMLTANCVLKTTAECRRKNAAECRQGNTGMISLVDRYKKKFPVVQNCRHCMNIIYNSIPLSLWSERGKWMREVDLRLDFTLETGNRMSKLLDAFLLGETMPDGEYTSGHEKRGVV